MNNYARAIDRFDVDLWQSVWHADRTLDYGDYGLRGEAADREFATKMVRGHEIWAAHTHQLTTSIVEVDGDRAVSETGASAILRGAPDASGRVVDDHYRGRYLDRWSKRDGRWAIDHRLMVEDFGWKQDADAARLGEQARRDRDDPAYELLSSLD